jgi:hypothetical protein
LKSAPLFFVLLTIILAAPLRARARSHPAEPSVSSDPSYVLALGAANHFLHAWQTGDVESGMVMLSDSIRHSQNSDKLENFFSNKTDRAFEITRGHGHPGRYTFPVVLVTPGTARGKAPSPQEHITRKFSEITLVEAGKNDWVVDKLP